MRVRSWPVLRRLIAAVLVLNLALGLAFSVIGLRHQADQRAQVQVSLGGQMTRVERVQAVAWRSIDAGRVMPALGRADLSSLADLASPSRSAGPSVGSTRVPAAAGYAHAVQSLRESLRRGDAAAASRWARLSEARRTQVMAQLRALSREHLRSSAKDSTIADAETLILMLFAAVVGLMIYRRAVAARLNGDLRANRARERFASLVRQSSDLISIVDADSAILYQTPSVRRMLGYEADRLVGSPLLDLVHPDDRAKFVAAQSDLLD
ncbi:MAG: PAS domain-containing protein, partial [Nocardioidaceae bacterium]